MPQRSRPSARAVNPAQGEQRTAAHRLVARAYDNLDRPPTVLASALGHALIQIEPGFRPAQYGRLKLRGFLEALVGEDEPFASVMADGPGPMVAVFNRRHLATPAGETSTAAALPVLQMGEVVDAHVYRVCDFGVFVKARGESGLVHRSELPAFGRFRLRRSRSATRSGSRSRAATTRDSGFRSPSAQSRPTNGPRYRRAHPPASTNAASSRGSSTTGRSSS